MRRAEVWWAELEGEAGFRPVVILSRSDSISRKQNVTIAEVTRVTRGLPCEIPLSPDDGMPVDCVVNTDNIHTIPKDRLRRRITALSPEKLFALHQALQYSLEIEIA